MKILICILFSSILTSCRTLGSLSLPGSLPVLPTSSEPPAHSRINDDNDGSDYNPEQDKTAPDMTGFIIDEEVYDSYVTDKKLLAYQFRKNDDLSVFLGSYVSRQGLLKELGDVGPSLGFELAIFSPYIDPYQNPNPVNHGWFILWTFDHFWKTNGNLLRPEFKNQDYTNYMLGGGYAFRWVLSPSFQLHYRGGLAFNFIEIDTNRSNGDMDDSKYSDITFSTIHKLGLDVVVKRAQPKRWRPGTQIRVGPSVFYYFAPDPLGDFKLTKSSKINGPGGSFAAFLEIKFEHY